MGPVLALIVLAALLRFPTLDAKSFWLDETLTVNLIRDGLEGIIRTFGSTPPRAGSHENTPPLYYVVAWAWTQVFGDGEVGLRSLSAVLGTALIPIVYRTGVALVSARVGLVAAALAAVNPFLVWYSQEARSYALLSFLTGLSFLYFARSIRGERRTTWKWGLVSALAICTHYFALFALAPQALWLLLTGDRGRALAVTVGLGLPVAAVLPLAIGQRARIGPVFSDIPLVIRALQTGELLSGFEAPLLPVWAGAVGLLAAVALWLLVTRADPAAQRTAKIAGAIAGVAIAGPVVAALAGFDYLLVRNLIPAVPALLIVLGVGFSVRKAGRLGVAAALALCVISAGSVAVTSFRPKYGVEDWRSAAEAVGPAARTRLILVSPSRGQYPISVYLPGTHRLEASGASVEEVVVLGLAQRPTGRLETPPPPLPSRARPPGRGFRLVERRAAQRFSLLRFRARRPTHLASRRVRRRPLGASAALMLQVGSDTRATSGHPAVATRLK